MIVQATKMYTSSSPEVPVRLRSTSLLSLALAFVLISPLKAGNPPAASQTDPPVYKTHAREVVVDVVVSKGGDAAVSGLHAKDFVVMEDGKPQTVDYFEEHSAKTLAPGSVQPLPPMPPGVYTNVPPAPEGDAVNVLLLDSLNTDQQDQTYVHGQIMNFLKSMQPGTKVAIFTLSSKLRMVQGFTTDTSVLRNALNDPKYGVSPTGASASRTLSDKFDDVDEKQKMAALGMSTAGMEALSAMQESSIGYKADQRVVMTLEALGAMARYLAGVPGRKNLIWFSSSFPVAVFPNARDKQPDIQLREYGTAIKETADLLTVSKIAVYPVGAEGVMSEHVFEANVGGPIDYEGGEVSSRSGPAGSERGGDRMTPYVNENAARSDKIMAMEQLAADTGGKAFYNTNDLNAAMQHAIADGSHYYTLVYSPTNKKMDGSYRRIEIKVPENKYKLAYRRGYNADDSLAVDTKPDTDPLHPLLLRGMPSSTQLLYGLRVVPVDPQPAAKAPRAGKNTKLTGPTKRYSVDFMIRSTDVQLQSTADGKHNGKLQIELLAYDREGNALNWVGGTQAMNLAPDLFAAMQHSGVPAHFEIDLPVNTEVFLETGVYDWATGKAGTLEVPLHPASITTASTSSAVPKAN